jgi:hypothetical protein
VTLVITSCTNRKRKPITAGLHIASIAGGALGDVASAWGARLGQSQERHPACDIYGGRGFREAVGAAKALDAQLVVVSAGLGLIDATTAVPAYGCTVLADADDSVRTRVRDDFSLAAWWAALREESPFAQSLAKHVGRSDGLLLLALSDAYLEMLAPEIGELPAGVLARVRIFTRASKSRIARDLLPLVMPYDDRLDGPDSSIRGTRSDFAARALAHFSRLKWACSASDDAASVTSAIHDWRMPDKVERVRHNDAVLVSLMRDHWDAAGGSSSRLLRVFRDDLGVACEQSRFASLARQVREERA